MQRRERYSVSSQRLSAWSRPRVRKHDFGELSRSRQVSAMPAAGPLAAGFSFWRAVERGVPEERERSARLPVGSGSEAGWQVNEFEDDAETLGQVVPQGLDANGFGSVMAAIQEIDA